MYNTLRNEEYKKYIESKGTGKFSAQYISWAVMHDRLKKNFSYVEYVVHEYTIVKDGLTLTLPYMLLADGSAIVKVTLSYETLDGDKHQHQECLAIRDFKMQAAKAPDSAQVENTIRRCIAKAGSMATGFGIELWFNEDIRDLDYIPPVPKKDVMTKAQQTEINELLKHSSFDDTGTRERIASWKLLEPTGAQASALITKLGTSILSNPNETNNKEQ